MRVEIVTAAASPAITLSDVKVYAFMNTDAYDNKINSLIEPATKYLERHIGRKLIDQVYDIWYDREEYQNRLDAYSNSISLYTFNVSSITSVTNYDPTNTSSVVTASDYRLSGNTLSAECNLVYNDYINIERTKVLIEHWVRDGQKSSISGRTELPSNFINLITPYMSMGSIL
jgi:uncharacterized phiE125 gp8 family phage protein